MESEGCWEVITCQPYELHVSLGCSQTCFSFPLWTDLTPGCNLKGDIQYVIPANVRPRDSFFQISTRLSCGFWIWVSFLLLLLYQMPEPDFLTIHRDNEIQWSSALPIPPRTSWSHVLFSYLPPPSCSLHGWEPLECWSGMQPPSVTNLNCCMMNYKACAGAVELFCVTNIPRSQLGVVIDEWEETADRRCVFGATSNLFVWMAN